MKGGQDPNDPDNFDPVTRFPPHPSQGGHHGPEGHATTHKNFDPLPWQTYFDELFYLGDGTSVFRAGDSGAMFFCIHGAGHSALSFATLARQIKQFGSLFAYDLKGHGYSKKDVGDGDYSIERLDAEAIEVLKQLMQKYPDKNVIIIGHSLGGSIACRIVDTLTNVEKNEKISGCIVIDVVQGTAIEALPFMNQIIADRPKHFDSVHNGIKWCYNTCTIRKLESARVSMPGQLTEIEKNGHKYFTWKVDLKSTEKYWMGWFKGLSKIFLGIHIPKILVTAEKERMDKELTIAQMQGKFKVVVVHNVGHSVHEDDFKTMAKECYNFLKDFRIPMTLQERAEKQLVGIANFHPNLPKYH